MKRIITTMAIVTAGVLLLAGCASVSGSSGPKTRNLADAATISALCGTDAAEVQATVAKAAAANPNTGLRHTLANWGVQDPTNDKAVASIQNTLNQRAKVKDCTTASKAGSVSKSKTKTKTALTNDERTALIKALTVKTTPASAECKADQYGNVPYQIDSLLGVPPRIATDAISTPITVTDPVAARVALQEAVCKDPLLGVTWLAFMATTLRDQVLRDTGIDLLVLNPRLKAYADVSQINAQATAFLPLLNVKDPSKTQLDDAIRKNRTWQKAAALVNTLLERFAVLGIEARLSLVNYHLTDYALDVDALPMVGINDKEESLPALIFSITEKGQCGEVTSFGANVGDKRPELFAAKTCAPPASNPAPKAKSHVQPTSPCPPGNTIPSCAPKSHNPADYAYPTGKPPVIVTTPQEATPPAVITTQPGGGGVSDTTANSPGTETGTTAPTAVPAPAAPATPPANVGGTNGAGDPGSF